MTLGLSYYLCISLWPLCLCGEISSGDTTMNHGFIKLNRTTETLELLKDPNAFTLLTVIALRARRTDAFNTHNLASGQALIGDYTNCGLTHRQYRTAQERLAHWGLATFRPTSRGTVATLVDASVYDINAADGDKQTTNARQTDDKQTTTNKKEKKEKKEKNYPADSVEWRLAEMLLDLILEAKPDFRRPDLNRWAVEIDRMIRLDGRRPERIEAVIRWCRADAFWQSNILSTAKLRKHFDRLELQMGRDTPQESLREQVARLQREDML